MWRRVPPAAEVLTQGGFARDCTLFAIAHLALGLAPASFDALLEPSRSRAPPHIAHVVSYVAGQLRQILDVSLPFLHLEEEHVGVARVRPVHGGVQTLDPPINIAPWVGGSQIRVP